MFGLLGSLANKEEAPTAMKMGRHEEALVVVRKVDGGRDVLGEGSNSREGLILYR